MPSSTTTEAGDSPAFNNTVLDPIHSALREFEEMCRSNHSASQPETVCRSIHSKCPTDNSEDHRSWLDLAEVCRRELQRLVDTDREWPPERSTATPGSKKWLAAAARQSRSTRIRDSCSVYRDITTSILQMAETAKESQQIAKEGLSTPMLSGLDHARSAATSASAKTLIDATKPFHTRLKALFDSPKFGPGATSWRRVLNSAEGFGNPSKE